MSLLALSLLAAAGPPAEVTHDPPPPGAVARIGNTRFRVPASSVFLSADGKEVILAGGEAVRVLDPATGKTLATIPVPGAENFYGLGFDPKAGRLTLYGHTTPTEERKDDDLALWAVDVPGREVLGRPVRLPQPEDDRLWRIAATPDGARVVIDGTQSIRVYDGRTGDQLAALPRRQRTGAVLAFPDGPVLVSYRHAPAGVHLWDWQTKAELRKLPIPALTQCPEYPSQVDVAGGLAFLACGNRVLVFDPKTGRQTAAVEVGGLTRGLAVRPDGKVLAVAPETYRTGDGVALWDVATGKQIRRLEAGRGFVNSLTWSADGSRLAAVVGGRLWVWDAAGDPVTPPPAGHNGTVERLAFAADGRLVTGGWDGTIRVWDPRTGQPGPPLVLSSSVSAVAVSPDGALVAGSSGDNDLRVWDSRTGAVRYKLPGNGRLGGWEVAGFSPDGKRLVTWGRTLQLRTWDMATGKLLAEHPTFPDGETEWDEDDLRLSDGTIRIGLFGLSQDTSRFALVIGRELRVYDTATGKERPRFDLSAIGGGSLAFSPDGKRLAATGHGATTTVKLPDGTEKTLQAEVHPLTVWDLEANKPAWVATTSGSSGAAVFSPDGRLVAEMTELTGVGVVIQWRDAATGKDGGRIKIAQDRRELAGGFAFDAAGKRVAVALADGTVAIYELTEGKKK